MQPKLVLDAAAKEFLALTFQDVRLRTNYSAVMPQLVNTSSKFSKRVPLNVPIVSAAMDTVTEWQMAVAIAKEGGLGVIHRFLAPKEQASQVRRVKLFMNGRIDKPITVNPHQTIAEIEQYRRSKGFEFQSFPVVVMVGGTEHLEGIVTRNDVDLASGNELVAKAMTRQVVTGSPDIAMQQAYDLMREHKIKVLPLVTGDKVLVGMYVASDLRRILSADVQLYNTDDENRLRVGAAIGTGPEALERVGLLVDAHVDVVVIDTAHGDSKPVYETLAAIKREFDIDVVVGNISERESARRLIDAGADGLKVGQGGGSICTTRIVTGIGCPQVSAVYACAQAVEDLDVPICSDGGIAYSGDIPIAIGAGAHSVMLGRLLAGAVEAPGETFLRGEVRYKRFRGMGSESAMNENVASRNRYGQEGVEANRRVPEGVDAAVPCEETAAVLLARYVGGLKGAMGYVGAPSIAALRDQAQFHRVTPAGMAESHPHDVLMLNDAPNYRK
ncbi:MAG: IMP dehydrogenase [Candidatus Buchananbacteria bacterium]|nr:IMP dehydrogenase [Candidatus Buchananbacteria bacterium]